jgi:GNAT superfamily N-acetyltransferase
VAAPSGPLDPGAVRTILSTAGSPVEDLDSGGLVRWTVAFHRVDDDGRLLEQVGHAHLVALPLADLDGLPAALLAEEAPDLGVIGRALFAGPGWRADVAAGYPAAVAREAVLVVQHCQLEARFRGRGHGPLLLGRALRRLRPGHGLVALIPDQLHGPEVAGKIAAAWQALGFAHWEGDVWLLDLTNPAFDAALQALEERL